MPLLTPPANDELKSVTVKLPESLLIEIKQYCDFTGLASVDDFVAAAMRYFAKKDSDYKKHCRAKKKEAK